MGSEVVFRDSAGRELTSDELQGISGSMIFDDQGVLRRVTVDLAADQDIPEQAQLLHQAGREAGGGGDYDRALGLFTQAAALAPDWPYPLYDAAFTHLLERDFAEALEYYRSTVALAPRGIFTALTAVHALEREDARTLPVGTFLAYSLLETIADPEAKEARVRELLAGAPDFAPAWMQLALLLSDDSDREHAVERGLASDPDPEIRGMLLMDRALMLFSQGSKDEAIAILGSLALDPASSRRSAEQAKAALSILLQQDSPR